MFTHKRTIYLRETDATGVLYFSEQFALSLEALEAYFLSRGFTLQEMIQDSEFLMPIVHASAEFAEPLFVGDAIEVQLSLAKVGNSSFTLFTEIFKTQRIKAGETTIVHVALSKKSNRSMPIPEMLLKHLREI